MHIGMKSPFYTYKMKGLKLEEVTIEKDLGVYISNNAGPSVQCQQLLKSKQNVRVCQKKHHQLTSVYPTICIKVLYVHTLNIAHQLGHQVLLEREKHRFKRMFSHLQQLAYFKQTQKLTFTVTNFLLISGPSSTARGFNDVRSLNIVLLAQIN